jgi:hypothetical protein
MTDEQKDVERMIPGKIVFVPTSMSMLEWYAGMALMGISANPDISAAASGKFKLTPEQVRKSFAKSAFCQAEEMIEEAERRKA